MFHYIFLISQNKDFIRKNIDCEISGHSFRVCTGELVFTWALETFDQGISVFTEGIYIFVGTLLFYSSFTELKM